MPNSLSILNAVSSLVVEVTSLFFIVLCCEAIAWYGKHNRLNVYLAVCIAEAVAGIPQGIFHLAQVALIAKLASLPLR